MTRLCSVVASTLFVLLSALQAQASARENEFGAGPVSSSLAGGGIASVNTAAATYLNPANLARCKNSAFDFGMRYISSQVTVNQSSGAALTSHQAADSLIAEVGGCIVVIDGLGVGVWTSNNLLKPLTLALTTPNDDIYVIRFSGALSSPTLMAGVGYAFIPQVSLGLAVQVSMHTQISQNVFAPLSPTNRPFSTLIGATVSPRGSIVAGLSVQPADFIAAGATFRTSNYGQLDVNATTQASALGLDIPPIQVNLTGIHDYSPRQYALGLTFKPMNNLSLLADVTYAIWSKFPGVFLSVVAAANSAVSSGIPLPAIEVYSFKDVLIPRVGAELLVGREFALRAGYSYHPAIVDLPKLQANLVDGDTHQFSLGGGYETHNEFIGFRLDAFFATHVMPMQSVTKTTTIPTLAYNFGGFALSTGLSAAIEF
jgi:long-subunit fatty acid transport protein